MSTLAMVVKSQLAANLIIPRAPLRRSIKEMGTRPISKRSKMIVCPSARQIWMITANGPLEYCWPCKAILSFLLAKFANGPASFLSQSTQLPSVGQKALDVVTKVVNINLIKVRRKMKSRVDRQIWITAKKKEER
uniref:Uncharacterized protein n=1 Tax=Romanomermis culicivorax TaxID=13658 RepID=A0A915IAG0_ROMCU